MGSLREKAYFKDQDQQKVIEKKKPAVSKIAKRARTKDKQISAKVASQTYHEFTLINEAQGLSNNSALNMIISEYVRKNRGIIE